MGNEGLASDLPDDPDTEEALKEFDFLVNAEDGEGAGEARSSGDGTEWGKSGERQHSCHTYTVCGCAYSFIIQAINYRRVNNMDLVRHRMGLERREAEWKCLQIFNSCLKWGHRMR